MIFASLHLMVLRYCSFEIETLKPSIIIRNPILFIASFTHVRQPRRILSYNFFHPNSLEPSHLLSESLYLFPAIQGPSIVVPQAPNYIVLCLLHALIHILQLFPLFQLLSQLLHIILYALPAQISQRIACALLPLRFRRRDLRLKLFKILRGALL